MGPCILATRGPPRVWANLKTCIISSDKSQYSRYTLLFHSPVRIGSFCSCFSLFLPCEIVFTL